VPALLIDGHETAVLQRQCISVFGLRVPRLRPRLADSRADTARTALTTQTGITLVSVDHVLFIGSADCFATAAVISRKEESSCSVIVNTHV
jgi:hypothetical protein